MDDIEIVIKISEKEYDAIKENKYGVFSGHVFETIRNGRPLSKVRTNEERWIPVTKKSQEQKTGHWIWEQYDNSDPVIGKWYCSECNNITVIPSFKTFNMYERLHYCPNCGAKMQEAK